MRRILALFGRSTPEEIAAIELQQARRGLLEAQTGAEYALAMVEYHRARIARLQEFLRQKEADK